MKLKNRLKKSKIVMKTYYKFLPLYCKMFPASAGKMLYRQTFGKELNLKTPKDLNEKINWLKIYIYRKDKLVAQCADKYRVREYVEKKGLGFILNDLFAVYTSVKDIKWEDLPNKFALKFNSAAGMNFICEDKNNYDKDVILHQVSEWFKKARGETTCELHYKNTKPVIVCERYITSSNKLPYDYKVFCLNGKPCLTMVCKERETHTKYLFVDDKYKRLYIDTPNYPDAELPSKPINYDEMIKYATILSADFPLCRVDFYQEGDRVIFGEMTFTPFGGYITCMNQKALNDFGALLKLPDKKDYHR